MTEHCASIDAMLPPPAQVETLIVDFDGVLCSDFFYHTLDGTNPDLYDRINREVFRGDKTLVRAWMRGETTTEDVHATLAQRFRVPAPFLDAALRQSIEAMHLNAPLLTLVREVRAALGRAVLLTDNMDVFRRVTVPTFHLDQQFDAIVTSCEEGKLKGDDWFALLDLALACVNGTWPSTLVLDDWPLLVDAARARGGHAVLVDRASAETTADHLLAWWRPPPAA